MNLIESNTKTEKEIIHTGEHYEEKLHNFQTYSNSSLLVLADFDFTFTRKSYNGKNLLATHGVIQHSELVDKSVLEKALNLQKKYDKYERDQTIPYEERFEKVKFWYNKVLQLYVEEKLNYNNFESIMNEGIKNNLFIFRYGLKTFLEKLKKYKIPLLIVSGGVLEIIEFSLKKLLGNEEYMYLINNNLLKIISNTFNYGKDKNILDVDPTVIHAYNKNHETNKAIKKMQKENGNFIVLGDNFHDIDMINTTKYNDIIGIAFENYKTNEMFLNKYDICIEGDGDFCYVNEMIDKICNKL